MNKYIENFQNANRELRKYLGIDNCEYIDFELDLKWSNCDEEVRWGKEEGEYASEIVNKAIYKSEEFTTFLVRSDFGGGNYYIVFDNKNYTEDLEVF